MELHNCLSIAAVLLCLIVESLCRSSSTLNWLPIDRASMIDGDGGWWRVNVSHAAHHRLRPVRPRTTRVALDESDCRRATFVDERTQIARDQTILIRDIAHFPAATGNGKLCAPRYSAAGKLLHFTAKQPERRKRLRNRRQTQTPEPLDLSDSNVRVTAVERSNVTISEWINITSGASTINIVEDYVTVSIDTLRASDVRIDPSMFATNMTVIEPTITVSLPTSQRSQQAVIIADRSEIYVKTNRSAQDTYIMMQNGASQATIESGFAKVTAVDADWTNVNIQTWSAPSIEEKMVITSNFSDETVDLRDENRVLSILLITTDTHVTISMQSAKVRIEYGNMTIDIDEDDHTISMHTGVYVVSLRTVEIGYTVVITDTINITAGEATMGVTPATSDVLADVQSANRMNIVPGLDGVVSVGGNAAGGLQEQQQPISSIDVDSSELQVSVLPANRNIQAVSSDSKAVITAASAGLKASVESERSTFEIAASDPQIKIDSSNVFIVIGKDNLADGDRPVFGLNTDVATGSLTATTTLPPIPDEAFLVSRRPGAQTSQPIFGNLQRSSSQNLILTNPAIETTTTTTPPAPTTVESDRTFMMTTRQPAVLVTGGTGGRTLPPDWITDIAELTPPPIGESSRTTRATGIEGLGGNSRRSLPPGWNDLEETSDGNIGPDGLTGVTFPTAWRNDNVIPTDSPASGGQTGADLSTKLPSSPIDGVPFSGTGEPLNPTEDSFNQGSSQTDDPYSLGQTKTDFIYPPDGTSDPAVQSTNDIVEIAWPTNEPQSANLGNEVSSGQELTSIPTQKPANEISAMSSTVSPEITASTAFIPPLPPRPPPGPPPSNLFDSCRSHLQSISKDDEFFPTCNPDGTYAPRQCDRNGYCWCVNAITGSEIQGTRRRRPDIQCVATSVPPNCVQLNEVYLECGSPCEMSCANANQPMDEMEACGEACQPGCYCQPGYVRNYNMQCIRVEECVEYEAVVDGKSTPRTSSVGELGGRVSSGGANNNSVTSTINYISSINTTGDSVSQQSTGNNEIDIQQSTSGDYQSSTSSNAPDTAAGTITRFGTASENQPQTGLQSTLASDDDLFGMSRTTTSDGTQLSIVTTAVSENNGQSKVESETYVSQSTPWFTSNAGSYSSGLLESSQSSTIQASIGQAEELLSTDSSRQWEDSSPAVELMEVSSSTDVTDNVRSDASSSEANPLLTEGIGTTSAHLVDHTSSNETEPNSTDLPSSKTTANGGLTAGLNGQYKSSRTTHSAETSLTDESEPDYWSSTSSSTGIWIGRSQTMPSTATKVEAATTALATVGNSVDTNNKTISFSMDKTADGKDLDQEPTTETSADMSKNNSVPPATTENGKTKSAMVSSMTSTGTSVSNSAQMETVSMTSVGARSTASGSENRQDGGFGTSNHSTWFIENNSATTLSESDDGTLTDIINQFGSSDDLTTLADLVRKETTTTTEFKSVKTTGTTSWTTKVPVHTPAAGNNTDLAHSQAGSTNGTSTTSSIQTFIGVIDDIISGVANAATTPDRTGFSVRTRPSPTIVEVWPSSSGMTTRVRPPALTVTLPSTLLSASDASVDCENADEEYSTCGTACELRCMDLRVSPQPCTLPCRPGCYCRFGLLRAPDNSCVQPQQCALFWSDAISTSPFPNNDGMSAFTNSIEGQTEWGAENVNVASTERTEDGSSDDLSTSDNGITGGSLAASGGLTTTQKGETDGKTTKRPFSEFIPKPDENSVTASEINPDFVNTADGQATTLLPSDGSSSSSGASSDLPSDSINQFSSITTGTRNPFVSTSTSKEEGDSKQSTASAETESSELPTSLFTSQFLPTLPVEILYPFTAASADSIVSSTPPLSSDTSSMPSLPSSVSATENGLIVATADNIMAPVTTATSTTTTEPTSTDDFLIGQFNWSSSSDNRSVVQFPVPPPLPFGLRDLETNFDGRMNETVFTKERLTWSKRVRDERHNPVTEQPQLAKPVDDVFLLSIGLGLTESDDTGTDMFAQHLKRALAKVYTKAKAATLGVTSRRSKRQVQLSETNTATTGFNNNILDNVNIKLTSIDRESTEFVRVRFYVEDGGRRLLADKAQDTFGAIDQAHTSAIIGYPVKESVQPYVQPESTSNLILLLASAAGALTVVVVVVCFIICYAKQVRKNRWKYTGHMIEPTVATTAVDMQSPSMYGASRAVDIERQSSSIEYADSESSARASIHFPIVSTAKRSGRRRLHPAVIEPAPLAQRWTVKELLGSSAPPKPARQQQQQVNWQQQQHDPPHPTADRQVDEQLVTPAYRSHVTAPFAQSNPLLTESNPPFVLARYQDVDVQQMLDSAFPLTKQPISSFGRIDL